MQVHYEFSNLLTEIGSQLSVMVYFHISARTRVCKIALYAGNNSKLDIGCKKIIPKVQLYHERGMEIFASCKHTWELLHILHLLSPMLVEIYSVIRSRSYHRGERDKHSHHPSLINYCAN